jgi:hypothetical protein
MVMFLFIQCLLDDPTDVHMDSTTPKSFDIDMEGLGSKDPNATSGHSTRPSVDVNASEPITQSITSPQTSTASAQAQKSQTEHKQQAAKPAVVDPLTHFKRVFRLLDLINEQSSGGTGLSYPPSR